ncbi:hypothetical protein CA13_16000 [Planctomycetes bacterium CA13]|uniref:Uncharacterized protein n=1 Tax=Novipirellula herctigrandis TaxID=2527986 RepID=A0A5C5Z030_9BACT|nr:hypothetical protein CA13_16000 [Planctomycetes bacterium CA13]
MNAGAAMKEIDAETIDRDVVAPGTFATLGALITFRE